MFDNMSKPSPYIPFLPPKAEYLKDTQGNKSTERGKQFVSNKYNFLLEVMKLLPHAEAEIYQEGTDYGKDDKGKPIAISDIGTLANVDNKFKYEFGPEGFGAAFGSAHFQSESTGDKFAILGEGGGKQFKKFDFTDAFYDFNHTNDGVNNANFFISKSEYNDTNKNAVYNDGDLAINPIPVYSLPAADLSNVYKTGMTQADMENFFPTDYNSLFFGMNPSMLNDGKLPDIVSYDSSLFQSAQDYFKNDPAFHVIGGYKKTVNGIEKIYYKNTAGNEIEGGFENKTPSFYQIMRDPTAPWNNGAGTATGWYAGKDLGQVAFNMAILLLESKRRYFAAMTQIMGPHLQFDGIVPGGPKNNEESKLDTLMIENQNRILGGNIGGGTDSTENWIPKETGATNKLMFRNFMIAQHQLSQNVDMFSEGMGLSRSWQGNDFQPAVKFRNWMLANLKTDRDSNFKSSVSSISLDTSLSMLNNQLHITTTPGTKTIVVDKTDPPVDPTPTPDTGKKLLTDTITYTTKDIVLGGKDGKEVVGLKTEYSFNYQQYNESDWTNLKTKLTTIKNNIPSAGRLKLASYRFHEYNEKIKNIESQDSSASAPTTTADLNAATSAIGKAVKDLGDEITDIKNGSSYDQMVYELYYAGDTTVKSYAVDRNVSTTGAPNASSPYVGNFAPSARYNGQPIGHASGYEKYSVNRGWDMTAGNFVSRIGKNVNGIYQYDYNDYKQTDNLGLINQQHHWYAPAQQIGGNLLSFFIFKGKAAKMNANEVPADINKANYKDIPVDKIWMTHLYGTLTEAFALTELTAGFMASMYNKMTKTQYENKIKQYKENKDEEYYAKIAESRAEGKAMAKKKSQDMQLKRAVESNTQKNKAQNKKGESKQKGR